MDAFKQLRTTKHLSENERVVVGYVLDHPDEVAHMSSRELARRTYTSGSTVLRLCKKLGYESYGDFRAGIVSELKRVNIDNADIGRDDSAVEVLGKISGLTERVVEETKRQVSPAELDAIVAVMAPATSIDIVASDMNAAVARYASHNFCLLGKQTTVYENMDKTIFLAMVCPKDHVVVLVSKSGIDRTVVEAARMLRERGVPTVAMTANVNSPLAGLCDHVLEVFYFNEFQRFGEIVFGTASKYLFDVLFSMLFVRDYDRVRALNDAYSRLYFERLDRGGVAVGSSD